jgi:hypothetical protein
MELGKQANLHYGTVSETIMSNLFVLTTKSLNDNVWVITRELLTRHTWNIARMSTNIIL